MKTSYGLEFDTVTEINPEWSDYDKTIAGCHLANARVVIVDTEYGQPIDNEHDLEEIYRILEKKRQAILKMNDIGRKTRITKEIQGTPAPYRPWKLHGSMGGADREGEAQTLSGT